MAEELSKEPLKTEQGNRWDRILSAQRSFINELACIREMVSLVLPVLKNKDEERKKRIRSLIVNTKTGTGTGGKPGFKSIEHLKEFVSHVDKLQHGDRMFRQGIIISVVSKFDEFVIDVLNVSYRENTGWLNNPDKKISYKELLEIQSLDALKNEIISKEIDTLMRDSHQTQMAFLDSKLKLGIEQAFPLWKDCLEITERRNLFVHTGGVVSFQYLSNCKRWGIALDEKLKEGSDLYADDEYIQKAMDIFYELSVRVAQASVRRMFPESFEDADKALNSPAVDLLSEERWALAERIFAFALNIPKDLISKGEMNFYFLLNRCIAMKHSGKPIKEILHSVDWRPFHPKFHFAVAILEDRIDDAAKLMKSSAVLAEVTEQNFKDWPLLRDFRKTDQFQNAYRELFKKDYGKELFEEAEREIALQVGALDESPTNT